ncbi:MAG: hypothetical protein COZ06_04105 [Armatimonadetes bacterium CG_4_10_14_3_um_filter_66_18]|nr:carbon-nitrogen hydrolase family protein [Armatimonadota bacterium]OIO94562.1 MAG: hypothetical protein AUJ96_28565 [Armatimonadetes bacterium CG2_30_66_41]PIU92256.1 MAG: hypothetical protein COS65_18915 [Armatimonadetes bacterium CG06_land_8_20_14_3_00_66_21]PIX40581.1 MAG: hypothetical protein COZ57_25510 [Armatimonadetes bacterium CG_4_8_14_3_um_filter_66_20]PIY51767.1 MAG: hypothetical protein COZ06_04105 [Armatimonadetes bacterium CG_4_10_14_3_um_filter_66_18]PIZ40652.1 MAG: hypotheti
MELTIAGAQLDVTNDIVANVAAITRAIAFAGSAGADILLTPEGSLSGYTHEFDTVAAEEALAEVTAQARSAGVGLALGTCFVEPDGHCYNQIRFSERDGAYLGFHSKTLTCGSLTDPPQGETNHFAVAPLRTFQFAGVTLGGLICNDLWANPGCTPGPDTHLTQRLAELGAQVVFHAVNGGRDGGDWSRNVAWNYHESNLRMRARAARIWVVTVDSCHPIDLPCSAPSGVIDPDGDWVCRAEDRGEQFFAHSVPLSA